MFLTHAMHHQLPHLSRLVSLPLACCAVLVATRARAADPTTADCLTANEKSIQLRSQHQFRDARSALLVCAAETCPADIRNECTRRVAELNQAMPTVVFEAKDGAGNDLSGVSVTMDGEVLAPRLEGTALSIDPGTHSFKFETPGQNPIEKQFVIVEGSKDRRERIVFGAPEGSVGATTSPTENRPHDDADGASSSRGDIQRIIGWSAAGVGAVGLALGGIFEIQRSNKLSSRDDICPSGMGCDPAEVERNDALTSDARTASTVALVSFVAGGVLIGGGLVTVFTAPHGERPQSALRAQHVALLPLVLPSFQGVGVVGDVW